MLEAVVITEMDRSYLRNVRTHGPKGFSFFFFFILNWATNPLVVGLRLKKDFPYQWNLEQRYEISHTVNSLLTETSVAETVI